MTKRTLKKAFNKFDVIKKTRDPEVPGILGFTINGKNAVEVGNRAGYVWVRLRSNTNEVIQAYNDQVSPVYGLPVVVVRDEIDRTKYKIKGRDLGTYQNWGGSAYLPRHGNQHSFNPEAGGGGDVVFVFGRQFMPLALQPSGTSGAGCVLVQPYAYYQGTTWKYAGGTGTASFLPYKPTGSNARMVLVYLDNDSNPQLLGGSDYFAASITGNAAVLPYVPAIPDSADIPLGAVRLVSGTSAILWDNIYDLRPIIVSDGFIPTGTSSKHEIQDDGTPLADRAALNFVGSNFVVYNTAGATNVSGTAVSIGGGGGIPERSLPIYEDGAFKVTGTVINFTDNLNVIVSGSVAYIQAQTGGGGGGSNVLPIQDSGAFVVTGTALSFDGDLLASAVGTVGHVSIPAGTFASGSHTHPLGSSAIPIYNNNVFKVTGTAFSFDDNLSVISSGTVAFISAILDSNLITYSINSIGNPPTENDLEGAFGNPGIVGAGFLGLINDGGLGLSEYIVVSDGSFWWYQALTKPSSVGATDIFSDTFTDASGTSLSAHTPDLGGSWTLNQGTWYIQSNHLEPNSYADGDLASFVATADLVLDADIKSYDNGGANYTTAGIVFRMSDANNLWLVQISSKLNQIDLYKRVASSWTLVDTKTMTIDSLTTYHIKIITRGTSIAILIDSYPIFYVRSTFNQTATRAGIRVGVSGSPTIKTQYDTITVETSTVAGQATHVQALNLTRYASNPIITRGATGTWEGVDVANPDVFWDTPNSRWVMNYSGYDGAKWRTGLAYSTDLLSWTKEPNNPVFEPTVDEGYIAANGSTIYRNGTYFFYYHDENDQIKLATSSNLLAWTRQGVVLSPGSPGQWDDTKAVDPTAHVLSDGTIEILYSGEAAAGPSTRGMGLATSSNGINFTKLGKLFGAQSWAQYDNGEPSIARTTGSYTIFYDSRVDNPGYRKIGQAFPLASGSFAFHQVTLDKNGTGWEYGQVFDSFPLIYNKQLYLFYAGSTGTSGSENLSAQIGVATSDWY